jgi:hypothetical protein
VPGDQDPIRSPGSASPLYLLSMRLPLYDLFFALAPQVAFDCNAACRRVIGFVIAGTESVGELSNEKGNLRISTSMPELPNVRVDGVG